MSSTKRKYGRRAAVIALLLVALVATALTYGTIFLLAPRSVLFTDRIFWQTWTEPTKRSQLLPSFVEILGVPAAGRYPRWRGWNLSRSARELKSFHGKIYIGTGDWDRNTGPAPLFYFDPQINLFELDKHVGNNYHCPEGYVDEEAIEHFPIVDGKLTITGVDSTESWAYGNLYVRENDGWQKFRTVPHALHVFDLCKFDNKLFAGIGTKGEHQDSLIVYSEDNGRTWREAEGAHCLWSYRCHCFFKLDQTLYATLDYWSLFKYAGKNQFKLVKESDAAHLFPDQNPVKTRNGSFVVPLRIVKPTEFNGKLVYLAFGLSPLKQQVYGLYSASNFHDVKRIFLGENSDVATDIKVGDDDFLYVLTNRRIAENNYFVSVYRSKNLTEWEKECQFNIDTPVGSMEIHNHNLYFGCCALDELHSASDSVGQILRVRQKHGSSLL